MGSLEKGYYTYIFSGFVFQPFLFFFSGSGESVLKLGICSGFQRPESKDYLFFRVSYLRTNRYAFFFFFIGGITGNISIFCVENFFKTIVCLQGKSVQSSI